MGCFGKKRSGYAKPGASGKHKKPKKGIQYANHRRVSGCFAALSYILSIALAAISLSGCSYSNSFSKGLYVAEIRRNASEGMPQLHLSVGYFGGCITLLDGTQPDVQASNSSDIGGETRCITNMHAVDEDDLLEELSEELKNPDNQFIQSFLNDTLHQARHFQKEVFHFAVPVTQLILFVVGGAMLFTASTNVVPKKSYRYLLVLAFLFIVFAMGLMFTTAFGSLQALHGLVNEQDSKLPPWAINSKNDSIHFANRLYFIQVGQACMVICFAIFIGFMFAGGLRAKRKGVV